MPVATEEDVLAREAREWATMSGVALEALGRAMEDREVPRAMLGGFDDLAKYCRSRLDRAIEALLRAHLPEVARNVWETRYAGPMSRGDLPFPRYFEAPVGMEEAP
jgi:hypothetical protein